MKYFVWAVLIVIFGARLILADHLPLTGDEAYYWEWSKRPAFGYVDHPPGVAWVAMAFARLGHRAFFVRFGFWLCGVVATFAAADAARRYSRLCSPNQPGNHAQAAAITALCLSLAPMLSLAFVTVSPDGPYLAAWACVLDLALCLQASRASRSTPVWLGLAVGAALLARVFALALVLGLLIAHRRERVAIGIILGLATACCVPFLVWNAQHGWVNFAFSFVGRHVNEGFSLIRPVAALGGFLAAFGVGPALLALMSAKPTTPAVLLWSALPLFAVILALSFFERVEIYWFFGPYLSLCVAVGGQCSAHVLPKSRLQRTMPIALGFGGALTLLSLVIACVPFKVLGVGARTLHAQLRQPGVFEIFTYHQLAEDVRDIVRRQPAVVLTDGYGFSSVLDYEAEIAPVVIGYDWQGREARAWAADSAAYPLALFVDKEPLSKRPDFAQRLAMACRQVYPGPTLSYALPYLPRRVYSTTWCRGMYPSGIGILRWNVGRVRPPVGERI